MVSAHRKLPSICSYWVEGKPRKNLNQVTSPDRDSNPGHLVSRPDALTVTPQVWTALFQNPITEPCTTAQPMGCFRTAQHWAPQCRTELARDVTQHHRTGRSELLWERF
ncbi:hypothetical protein ANN_09265 [Periplaneta americana]|uniref:Uncharacterized protein n=1 Tax=Periplaneta americana TaxID=6978 RepID=A0ABQ8TMC1_PERAM|nr:hypothetical protein ANN_09265 [Periplaneta americana]